MTQNRSTAEVITLKRWTAPGRKRFERISDFPTTIEQGYAS